MLPLVIGGGLGVVLHYNGGLEFQADMDPTLSRWHLFWKVVRMQAPPALAPGILVQLGLLGLIATYRDPLGRERVRRGFIRRSRAGTRIGGASGGTGS